MRAIACVVLLLLAGAASARAQAGFPSRPVRIVSPFAAASVSDISLRLVAERLGPRLGTQVLVDNQPTGGGTAAARAVLTAAPDGHTLALLSNATAVSVALFKTLPYDPLTDFAPISGLSDFAYVFLTNVGSKLGSVADVRSAARARPGTLNFGTAAAGTTPYLTALLFKKAAGLDFVIVPFRGAGDLTVALIRNDVDVVINAYGAVRQSLIDGQLRAIATTSPARSALLPDVPTVQESGIGSFDVTSWNGIFAPERTPPEIIERLQRELAGTLAEPDLVRQLLDLGVEARPSTQSALGARLRVEIERWTRVVQEAGIERQ
jgi:tripartite-type tricarboxylate transporter receptor subunit TctC